MVVAGIDRFQQLVEKLQEPNTSQSSFSQLHHIEQYVISESPDRSRKVVLKKC
jgi:hypothetical protein